MKCRHVKSLIPGDGGSEEADQRAEVKELSYLEVIPASPIFYLKIVVRETLK